MQCTPPEGSVQLPDALEPILTDASFWFVMLFGVNIPYALVIAPLMADTYADLYERDLPDDFCGPVAETHEPMQALPQVEIVGLGYDFGGAGS